MQREDVGDVARLAVADLDPERRHQDEVAEACRGFHGHLGGDPAAQRGADHHRVPSLLLGQQVQVQVREIVDGVDGRRLR